MQAVVFVATICTFEEGIEPFKGIGPIRILVSEAGHGVDVICQPGRARKPERGIAGQIEGANADAEGIVEEVCPGADQREDIDVITGIEPTSDELVLAMLELLVPVERVEPPPFIIVGKV